MFKNHIIDKLTEPDYAELMEVWESSVRATHHFLNASDIQAYKSLISNKYLNQLQLFGVKSDELQLLGFIGISDQQIRLLFISPAKRGMGIGCALVNYVYQHLGIKEVDVNEQNTQAYDFYRYLGFVVTDRSAVDSIGKPFPVLSMQLP